MERLTERLENGVINVKYASQHETAIHRLVTIEDILGDEYELDDLKTAMWCKEIVGMAFSEDTAPVERLRELWFADKDGRCVVLPRLEPGHGDNPGEPGVPGPPGIATDVAPVRYGRWIPADQTGDCCYTCSECGFERDAYLLDVGNYCPNCGAKMSEKEDKDA